MFNPFLAREVEHLQKEYEYYHKLADEQREIIEQLTGTGQPKGYVYMHPFDVAECMQRADAMVNVYLRGKDNDLEQCVILGGRKIRQSANIPAITKRFD